MPPSPYPRPSAAAMQIHLFGDCCVRSARLRHRRCRRPGAGGAGRGGRGELWRTASGRRGRRTSSGLATPGRSAWSCTTARSRAAPLRAVCSCGWNGPEQCLHWEEIGDQHLQTAGSGAADTCMRDWDEHTIEVERSAVLLPEAVTALLAQLEVEVEKPAKSSPLAAIGGHRGADRVLAGPRRAQGRRPRQGRCGARSGRARGPGADAEVLGQQADGSGCVGHGLHRTGGTGHPDFVADNEDGPQGPGPHPLVQEHDPVRGHGVRELSEPRRLRELRGLQDGPTGIEEGHHSYTRCAVGVG